MIPKCELLWLVVHPCRDVFDGDINSNALALENGALFVGCRTATRRGITSGRIQTAFMKKKQNNPTICSKSTKKIRLRAFMT